jgi:hypothetical protein
MRTDAVSLRVTQNRKIAFPLCNRGPGELVSSTFLYHLVTIGAVTAPIALALALRWRRSLLVPLALDLLLASHLLTDPLLAAKPDSVPAEYQAEASTMELIAQWSLRASHGALIAAIPSATRVGRKNGARASGVDPT